MSKGRQALGAPPAKVTLDSVGETSAADQQQACEVRQGEIERFYQSCRQTILLTGSTGLQRIKALEGGGQLEYVYNYGQEHLNVVLPSRPAVRVEEEPVKPKKREDEEESPTTSLAIDILFEQTFDLVGDVYWTHKTVYAPEIPGTPGDPFPSRISWSVILNGGDPGDLGSAPDYPLPEEVVTPPPNPFNFRFGPSTYYRALGALEWFEPPDGSQGYETSAAGVAYLSPISSVDGESISEVDFNLVYGYPKTDDLNGTRIRISMSWRVPGAAIGVPPTPEFAATFQFHKTVRLFDTLHVAGLRVTPPADPEADPETVAPYEAISTQESTDDRLRALSFYESTRTAVRALTVADPKPWITGRGFVALPMTDADGEETIIDVYVDTANLLKWNSAPGAADVTLEADHPSFSYDLRPQIKWKLRAREFKDQEPTVIGISTSSEQTTEVFVPPPAPPTIDPETGEETPSIYEYMPDTPATESLGQVTNLSPRITSWAFWALDTWVDPGGDPTAGDDPALGMKLAEVTGTTTAGGPTPLPREFVHQPAWAGGAAQMTKIATIRWTPATADAPGTAVIETA